MEKKVRPNIQDEMDEFERMSQDLMRDEDVDVSVQTLVDAFKNAKEHTLSQDIWSKLENTESNEIVKDDWKAVFGIARRYGKTDPLILKKAIRTGEYKRPLIVKMGDRYILMAGNTRLCTAAAMGVAPKVFIGDITNNINETAEQFSPPPHESETYDKIMGTKHKKHNPYDDEDDKDDVFPTGSGDWRKKKDVKEQGADAAGAFEAPLGASGGDFTVLKRDLHKFKGLPNVKGYEVTEKEKLEEQMTADVSAGASYDVPLFGKTPRGGRKDPLAIEGPKSIAKSRAVTDPKFPKWGGPGGVFIKIKEKCKKFPYCNQGDINAIEPLREAITKAAEKYGIPRHDVEKIVINEINKIFINYEGE